MTKKSAKCIMLLLTIMMMITGCSGRIGNSADKPANEVEETAPTPTPTPTPVPTPEPTPTPQATRMQVPITKNGRDVTGNLSDNEMWSSQIIEEDDRFEIGSLDGELIDSLYFIWTKRPLPYVIVYPDGSVQNVEGDMLHQVVRLEKPASLVSVSVSYAGTTLDVNELSAYTEGVLPDDVQDWKRMEEGEADICLFPTHADDEYVFFGGILPYYAGELGYKVQVCWMCCHDNNYIRNHELLNALWKSGCRYYPEINYNALDFTCASYDEAVRRYTVDQFERYQVEMIRKYRPYVVVGHDEKGEYGHGAHILASVCLERAVSDAAKPELFTESSAMYGAWDVQKTYIHLYGKDPTILDYDTKLEKFDGLTAYEVALQCYEEHKTQFENSNFTVYREDSPYDSAKFGLQRTTVGADEKKNDLLENVKFSEEKTGIEYVPTASELNAKKMTGEVLGSSLFKESGKPGELKTCRYTVTDIATGRSEEKSMQVYLPYGYDETKKYDVLVLAQGESGDETYWFAETKDEAEREVSLKNLLDNMIADGQCEPLIVVSTSWANNASCKMTRFDMNDLTIASAQQAAEMRRDILPFIIENYSTYAASSSPADIKKARDHFGYVGISWSAMTGILGMMREDTDCFSWFGSFAPGLFDLNDTVKRIDAVSTTQPIRYFLMCCGTDEEIDKSESIYTRLAEDSASLVDGQNCEFIEIQGGAHWYGTWLAGIYNSLLVFFRK